MNILKRERSEDSHDYHARKKLRIRLPIIPKVKEEEPFVAYNHLDTIEYLYDQEDEEWKGEDDCIHIPERKPRRKHRSRGPRKETPFRNIFWGTQQSAWMGSVRVKGTIVRSCSRKSDVLAAKILNTRCKQKGICPPNPEVGFLSTEELSLRTHSQTRARGKTKCDPNALGKQNRNLPKKPRKKTETIQWSIAIFSFQEYLLGNSTESMDGEYSCKGNYCSLLFPQI